MDPNNQDFRKSKLLELITKILSMQNELKEASKMAFEGLDEDGSNSLDKPEV